MREIKFRGKRLDNGQWIEGFFFKTEVGCFIGPYNDEIQVDPSTVGQFTGLKDKNGKEIWEGDIIKLRFSRRVRRWDHDWVDGDVSYRFGKVFYYDGGFALNNTDGYEDARKAFCYGNRIINKGDHTNGEWEDRYDEFEKVGNIHDNAELLK